MNKKKIIVSILVLFFTAAISYFFIFPKFNKPSATSGPEETRSIFVPPSGMPPLSIKTDKTSYEYKENVKINVIAAASAKIPPFETCRIEIKRTESRDGKETFSAGLEEKYVLGESSKECKEYRSGFVFSLDGANSKSLEWNQLSCEKEKIPAPAIPDYYSIIANCEVEETEGYSGPKTFSDAKNITIGENASCENKKIEISKAGYDKKGILSVVIKNTGTENIENVRIYLDKCANSGKIKDEKDSGKIAAGSYATKTFANQIDCRYASLNAHIDECYDHNPESWAGSEIIVP